MKILLSMAGLILSLAICVLLSNDRKAIAWKRIGIAIIAELMIAFFIVRIPIGAQGISLLSRGVTAIIQCGNAGLDFVFGDLFHGGTANLYVFLVQGLGNIIFVSALVSALYYLGIIPWIVKWIGRTVGRLLGTSEVESFVSVANMFLGHTDSPILVAKYLSGLTDSELFVILVSGMGSMSAAILGGYVALGIPMKALLLASALVPVGSILVAKILFPQAEAVERLGGVEIDHKENRSNVIEALSEGANTGIQMVIAIAATLVAFLGVVELVNVILGWFSISLEQILGYLFAPFAYLLGLEGDAVLMEGALLGKKLILNEFVAFGELSPQLIYLDARSALLCIISLCGFANISSMGMCIGSLGTLCPEKRGRVAGLVTKAMIGGVLVSLNSAFFVGMVFGI